MATNVKQMIEAANATVHRLTPTEAREMIAKGNTLVVDVRDAPELEKSGKVAGAVHHSRGMGRSALGCARTWAMAKSSIWAPSRIGWRAVVKSASRSTNAWHELPS
jgi:predicted sulfurtransferase